MYTEPIQFYIVILRCTAVQLTDCGQALINVVMVTFVCSTGLCTWLLYEQMQYHVIGRGGDYIAEAICDSWVVAFHNLVLLRVPIIILNYYLWYLIEQFQHLIELFPICLNYWNLLNTKTSIWIYSIVRLLECYTNLLPHGVKYVRKLYPLYVLNIYFFSSQSDLHLCSWQCHHSLRFIEL